MAVDAIFISNLTLHKLPPSNPPQSQQDLLALVIPSIVSFIILLSIIICEPLLTFSSFFMTAVHQGPYGITITRGIHWWNLENFENCCNSTRWFSFCFLCVFVSIPHHLIECWLWAISLQSSSQMSPQNHGKRLQRYCVPVSQTLQAR